MRNTWLRFAAAAAIAGGMLLAAQEGGSQPAQVAHGKAEFQAARQSAQPIRRQLKQVRSAMFQAARASDTARIDQLSAREANLRGHISAMRHEAFGRIYSTLTPEQRAKADRLPAHFRQMRQRRMESNG